MNKPVAWMDKNDRTRIRLEQEWADDIPLYTHPVKELTDEEIIAVYVENYGDDILPNIQASGIEFAKAILRKAQEK